MIDFWDIEFDLEKPFYDEDFIEGLLKLGFEKLNESIMIKEVVNEYGNLVPDGVIFDLSEGSVVYFPHPDSKVSYKLDEPDIDKLDSFLKNHII